MDKEQETKPTGFDLKVTYRDEKTGLVIDNDSYTLRVLGSADGKTRLWERPKGSGNLFDRKGNSIGRWVMDPKTKKGQHEEKAEHIAWTRPETQDQKLARSLNEKDQKIAELERELLSISEEKTKKDTKPFTKPGA